MKKTIIVLLVLVMMLSLTLTAHAYNDEFYDEAHDWLLDYGMVGDYAYEIYVPPHQPYRFNIRFVLPLGMTLVLQSVVTYTDSSYDLYINYGWMTEHQSEVSKSFEFPINKTVETLDFDCHIYENNVYQATCGIRIFY